MSIFVDENELFSIKLYYKEFRDDNGFLIYTDVSNEKIEDWDELEAWFCQPSTTVFSFILEQATVLNALNQRPVIATRTLRDLTLLHLMKKWSMDGGETNLLINEQTIGKLDFKVSNELFLQYIYNVKLDIYLQAIIKNENESENVLRRF